MERALRQQIMGGLLLIAGFCIFLGLYCYIGAGIPGRRTPLARVPPETVRLHQQQGIFLLGAGTALGVVICLVAGFAERGVGSAEEHAITLMDRYQSDAEGRRDFGPTPLPGFSLCARVQFADGTTEEVTVDPLLYRHLTPGERGTAVLRGSRLLQFRSYVLNNGILSLWSRRPDNPGER